MIVSNDFVYLHHPKTGGTFVTRQLEDLSKRLDWFRFEEVPGKKHAGIGQIPEEHRGKQCVINVRNVFDHYVSRYTFKHWVPGNKDRKRFNLEAVKQDYPHFPEVSFTEFLTILNHWDYRNTQRGRRHSRRNRTLAELEIGHNSYVLAQMTLANTLRFLRGMDELSDTDLREHFSHIRFLHTERLNDDLADFLVEVGVPAAETEAIRESGRILPKAGGRGRAEDWRDYYNDVDAELVRHRDRMYLRLFPEMDPAKSE